MMTITHTPKMRKPTYTPNGCVRMHGSGGVDRAAAKPECRSPKYWVGCRHEWHGTEEEYDQWVAFQAGVAQ